MKLGQADTGQHYVLVPAMPAPNGRLHLGHMAGPYLRLDMLARHLRRGGNQAAIICASDPYDSYIPLRAEQTGQDSSSLARESCAGIISDLDQMDIDIDLFIDPLAAEHQGEYLREHADLVSRLRARGLASIVHEKMPYSRERERFITGSYLEGDCPTCHRPVSGFFCEECGAHFQPDAILRPHARGLDTLDWRDIDNMFLKIADPDALLEQLQGTETEAEYLAIAARHLRDDGPRFRLTSHAGWGLVTHVNGEERTLFGHGLLLAAIRLVGAAYAARNGLERNPFDQGSDVITVNGFGIDNCVSHLVGIQATALADSISKPFDRFSINHFYTLEGEKFSTSQQWAIWVRDLFATDRLPSDLVRAFLAATNPARSRTDFDCHAFITFANEEYAPLHALATATHSAALAQRVPTPLPSLIAKLEAALDEQSAALGFVGFDPRAAWRVVTGWAGNRVLAASQPYWWLKGLSLLSEPVMPNLARTIWSGLGHTDAPSIGAAMEQTHPVANAHTRFVPLSLVDLAPMLPRMMAEAV
jgi:methionyl-tRNA synthetase